MNVRQTILLITVMFWVSACSTLIEFAQLPNQPVNQELIADGIVVYRQNYCGSCHALSIANTHGTFAPNHDNIVADSEGYIVASTYIGDANSIEDYIRESIINPTIFYTPSYEASNHHMPSFAHLSEDDINALVYMFMNQAYYQSEVD